MKTYKNLEELNKEWKPFGFRVNEKGEILATHEGKEYKFGKLRTSNNEQELKKMMEKDQRTEKEKEKI